MIRLRMPVALLGERQVGFAEILRYFNFHDVTTFWVKNTALNHLGAVNKFSDIGGYLAGVPFSCISRVSPVSTIGVWSGRNLPPQISAFILSSLYTIYSFLNLIMFDDSIPFSSSGPLKSNNINPPSHRCIHALYQSIAD